MYQFFKKKRELVDNFIFNEWTPNFIKNLFGSSEIKKVWQEIVENNDTKKRQEFILEIFLVIQKAINKRRVKIWNQILKLEKEEKI